MITRILALDPGYSVTGGCGVAIFQDGLLETADLVMGRHSLDILLTASLTSRAVVSWARGFGAVNTLVAEWPQIYVASRSPGDPNDLLALAGICCGVALGLDVHCVGVQPRTWKGTAPKAAIGKRVMARLSPSEAMRIVDWGARGHNVLDAVGIGLHHLGRFDRQRVIPR